MVVTSRNHADLPPASRSIEMSGANRSHPTRWHVQAIGGGRAKVSETLPLKMRIDARQVIELERLSAGRCPIHVRHNAGCSICVRVARRKANNSEEFPVDAAEHEIGKYGLQGEIMGWCDAQWPKWVYDFPRTDLKSTLPSGRHDATVWGPFPKCFLIETKAKGKKRTEEQLIWAARLQALGWEVRVIYSLNEFKKVIANELSP